MRQFPRMRTALVAVPAVAALFAPVAPAPWAGEFWVGVALVLAGWGGRMWAEMHGGDRRARPATVVPCGPFRVCRHPIVLADTAIVLGVVAASEPPGAWVAGGIAWCSLVSPVVAAYDQSHRRGVSATADHGSRTLGGACPPRSAPGPGPCAHRLESETLMAEGLVLLVLLPVLIRSLLLA